MIGKICLGSFAILFASLAFGDAEDVTRGVMKALQNKEYEQALALANQSDNPNDSLLYLKALGLFHLKRYDEAIDALAEIQNRYKDSQWLRKSRFLEAKCRLQLKQFEDAERIYRQEAERILSQSRKSDTAGIYVRFAEELSRPPDQSDVSAPPPNYRKAYEFYKKALELELSPSLTDEIMFRAARTVQLAGGLDEAVREYEAYLIRFDPKWNTPSNVPQWNPRGYTPRYVEQARYRLAESHLQAGRRQIARRQLEQLLIFAERSETFPEDLRADVDYLITRTYLNPGLYDISELDDAVKSLTRFIESHPSDPRVISALYEIGSVYAQGGRSEEAIAAFRDFLNRDFSAVIADKEEGESPQEQFEQLSMSATFEIAKILRSQGKYSEAIAAWEQYVTRFPNGPQWTEAQRLIVDTEYEIGLSLIRENKEEEATKAWDAFMEKHPLDPRQQRIIFTYGLMAFEKGQYEKAIAQWEKLVSKFPNTEESSLALFKIGETYEFKLSNHAKALESYRKLTWGSWSEQARNRIEEMTRKSLKLSTPRVSRVNEPAVVSLALRNIEKCTVDIYRIDLEAYWRKMHRISGVEDLDIGLISPDKSWQYSIDGYEKYVPYERKIDIPMDGPGVYAVHVADEDLEATTLLIRSNIDMIIKASRKELLVFAEDVVEKSPVTDAKVLVSDGQRVIFEGKTSEDGVILAKIDELRNADQISVLVEKDGHVASDVVSLSDLDLSRGISPAGFIYTDKSTYLPGGTVNIKGIIRRVKDGSYFPPVGEEYRVSIISPNGRILRVDEVRLNDFGTFSLSFTLDSAATIGEYRIAVNSTTDKAEVYGGEFAVEQYRLAKMKLDIEFPRRVFFRGEVIEATIKAAYYYGQPVVDHPVRYTLPNGESYTEKTDAEGKIRLTFDTASMMPGQPLNFQANLLGEEVVASDSVFLAKKEYSISLATLDDVVISGEPFSLDIITRDAGGTLVSKALKLSVLRREIRKPHPVLSQIPWILPEKDTAGEVLVEQRDITTDQNGKATVTLKLEKGGKYVLRCEGTDRFGQPVIASTNVTIFDDEDSVKLRVFAEERELMVGREYEVRIHSRMPDTLALLTFEGEGIISHEVINLPSGWTSKRFTVSHEHFPNFHFSISAIDVDVEDDGTPQLRTAGKSFVVKRELFIDLDVDDVNVPGEKSKAEITVKDQAGNPVRAELSLALVDESLLAIYPERVKPITEFFNEGLSRQAAMRTVSSCDYSYHPPTRAVLKEILEEEERLEMAARDKAKKEQLAEEWADGALVSRKSRARFMVEARPTASLAEKQSYDLLEEMPMPSKFAEAARKELVDESVWIPTIVTDENGRATVTVTMPEKTAQWRAIARGCTPETLVGEKYVNTITRKDFFVEIKMPRTLTQGDSIRLLARLHNLSDYEGTVDLSMRLEYLSTVESRKSTDVTVTIASQQVADIVFPEQRIDHSGRLVITVSARAGDRFSDTVSSEIQVRPWGMEYSDTRSGTASANTSLRLKLPDDLKYENLSMTIDISPNIHRMLIDLALDNVLPILPKPFASERIFPPGDTGSDLLAVAYAMEYASKVNVPIALAKGLIERAKYLVLRLVDTQREDGGWSWCGNRVSDRGVTATALWALAQIKKRGISVNDETLTKAVAYLKKAFSEVEAENDLAKAQILHALSVVGQADFAYVNRLYRNRNMMDATALAFTALAFSELNRNEIGDELLTVLESKWRMDADESDGDRRVIPSFSRVETMALVLLAFERVRPSSPLIPQIVERLTSLRSRYGYSPRRAKGIVVAALATYYGATQFEEHDYVLDISVNGNHLKSMEIRKGVASAFIHVSPELLVDGENRVDIHLDGRGNYGYTVTLSGFSSEFRDPQSWEKPRVISKNYYHAPLEYAGRRIADSTSRVTQLPVGERTQVSVLIERWNLGRHLVIQEYLPGGTALVEGSLSGNFQYSEVGDSMITLYYPSDSVVNSFRYELVGVTPGKFQVMPTIIKDAVMPGMMRIGEETDLEVLAPGERSRDEYDMNDAELYGLGVAYFNDGDYGQAVELLAKLYSRNPRYNERELARMLLWIYTMDDYYSPNKVIECFEVLRERHPELYIPFDKILIVGRAYHDMGEFERAYLIYEATIDSSYANDSNVGAVLEDEGQFLTAVEFQERLWREYPDSPSVVASYFGLSQSVYSNAARAEEIANQRYIPLLPGQAESDSREITRLDLLKKTIDLLSMFISLYPESPLADEATFSLANALMDVDLYDKVVEQCRAAQRRYPESEYLSSFQYMEALGLFWQRDYDASIKSAEIVAGGDSKDRDLARYILGQIYHAKGDPASAIRWYQQVRTIYPDADESISYFERKDINIGEVTIVRPGEEITLKIKHRNINEGQVQVYKVDLMRLYLREKNLSNIREVKLAGIEPQVNLTLDLGDDKDYVDKESQITLDLKDEGAYLVICRGDDLFTSGLVLITPLEAEVQEDAISGRVRVNIKDIVSGGYREGVHIKVIGSADSDFRSGETDLRGLFVADNINGVVTVIARYGTDQYAFYRGKEYLGRRPTQQVEPVRQQQVQYGKSDYRANTEQMNQAIQSENVKFFDQLRRGAQRGVQVQLAH